LGSYRAKIVHIKDPNWYSKYILLHMYYTVKGNMLSKKLKELRKKAGWSQQKLAEKAGLSYNAITKIEQGAAKQPTIQTIMKIADAFGVSLDEVVGRTER